MTQQPSTTLLSSLAGSTNNVQTKTETPRAGIESNSNALKFKDIVESAKADNAVLNDSDRVSSSQNANAEQLQSVMRALASLMDKSGKLLPQGQFKVNDGSTLSELENAGLSEEQLDTLVQQINALLEQADITPQQLVSHLSVAGKAELFSVATGSQSLQPELPGDAKSVQAALTEKSSLQLTGIEAGGLTRRRLNQLAQMFNQAVHGLLPSNSHTVQSGDDISSVVPETGQVQAGEKAGLLFTSIIGHPLKTESKSNGVTNIGADFELDNLTQGLRSVKGDLSLGQFDKWLQGQLNGGDGKASSTLLAQSSTSGLIESFAKISGQAGLELSQAAASPTAIAASIAESTAGTSDSARAVATAPLVMYGKQWQGDLSQKINWMMKAGLEQAEIQLDPKELGPINIRVIQGNGEVQVVVQAQHGQTRELFESNQERLREMLEQQGINLSQFDVQSQSRDDKSDSEYADTSNESLSNEMEEETLVNEVHLANTPLGQRALLDLFV